MSDMADATTTSRVTSPLWRRSIAVASTLALVATGAATKTLLMPTNDVNRMNDNALLRIPRNDDVEYQQQSPSTYSADLQAAISAATSELGLAEMRKLTSPLFAFNTTKATGAGSAPAAAAPKPAAVDQRCEPDNAVFPLLYQSRCVCSEAALRRRIGRRKLWERLGFVSTITLCTGRTIRVQKEIDLTNQRIYFQCGKKSEQPLKPAERCTIAGATASTEGQGTRLFVSTGGRNEKVTFVNIDFVGGYAFPGHGGAMSFDNTGGDITLQNCTFTNNTGQFGGAIIVTGTNSKISIRNSSFRGNNAEAGGAIFVEKGVTINITNSIVASNLAVSIGGGMVAGEGTKATVVASRFLDNQSGIGGGLLAFRSKVNLFNSLFINNKNLQNLNDISILDDANPAQNGTYIKCDAKSTVKFCDGFFGILEMNGKSFLNTNCDKVGVEGASTCPVRSNSN